MEENNNQESFFREIMSKSRLEVPFSDFDDNVMQLVQKQVEKKSAIAKDVRLSWIFFVIGSVFGIVISVVLPKLQEPVLGIHLDKLSFPFQIIFAFLLVYQFDSLISFYKRGSQKR